MNHNRRSHLAPYPESPVVTYDTSGWSSTEKPPNGLSRQNVRHAQLVAHLVEEMLASVPDPQREVLGVVTPYTAQVRLIEEHLRQRHIEQWVRVGTIHTFQGLEFVGVIFDTVDAPGTAFELHPRASRKQCHALAQCCSYSRAG